MTPRLTARRRCRTLRIRPVWPVEDGDPRMQMHLDIEVDDLTAATEHALAVGAELAEFQPKDDVRGCLRLAGHSLPVGPRLNPVVPAGSAL